jgi:hypothetical protein
MGDNLVGALIVRIKSFLPSRILIKLTPCSNHLIWWEELYFLCLTKRRHFIPLFGALKPVCWVYECSTLYEFIRLIFLLPNELIPRGIWVLGYPATCEVSRYQLILWRHIWMM